MPYDPLVHAAQIGLNTLGFKLKEDGLSGSQTVAALRNWQLNINPLVVTEGEIDERTLKNIATLEPKAQDIFKQLVIEAKKIAAGMGYEYVAISGNRTFKEQDALYAKGRTAPGPRVTNARAGFSNHNFGIALDFGVFKDGKYLDDSQPATASQVHRAVSKIAEKYGIDWGGAWSTFKDEPHYEVKSPLSMASKRERILAGKPILA